MVSVSFQLPTTPNHQIWDVKLGIGLIKSVLPALTTGSSTQREFVFQFQIYAKLTMHQEPALPVMLDTIWLKEFVFTLPQILLNQLIWDVPLGIGPTKNVLPAQRTGSSTPKESAFQFLIYAKLTMHQEPALLALLDTI
jgi:hypothetical protein